MLHVPGVHGPSVFELDYAPALAQQPAVPFSTNRRETASASERDPVCFAQSAMGFFQPALWLLIDYSAAIRFPQD